MRSLKTPKDLKPIFKFDGTELTKEDIHQLYIIDGLSIATMALLFDIDTLTMFYHARKHHYGHRKHENYLYGEAMNKQEKRFKRLEVSARKKWDKEVESRDREIWAEAERLYGKPKPKVEYITINGKTYADRDLLNAYNRHVKEIYMQHKTVVFYEKTQYSVIPKELSDIYFKVLKISKREYKKIIECLSGDRKTMFEEEDRVIPEGVRTIVWERDGGKCTKCGRKEYLHFHHIMHFSKGGEHKAKNLKLLCIGCHADVHYGEQGYAMLKAKAEKLGVSVNVS